MRHFKIIFIIFFYFYLFIASADSVKLGSKSKLISSAIGPYFVAIRVTEICEFPNADLEHMPNITALETVNINKTAQIIRLELTYPKDVCVSHIFLQIEGEKKSGIFDIALKRKYEKACEHPIFGRIMKNYLSANKNCCVKKGAYRIEVNPNELGHLAFNEIQYNAYTFKLDWFTKKGQLGCVKLIVAVKPPEKKAVKY